MILMISSCTADLGKFSDSEDGIEEFYDSVGDIKGKYDATDHMENIEYGLKESITNDAILASDPLNWEDGAKEVEYRQYVYIVIPFKRDLKIESVSLFVKLNPEETGYETKNLEFSAFYYKDSSSLPADDDLKLVSDPDTKKVTKKDEQGHDIEVEEEIEYADPKKENRIASAQMTVTGSFDGFVLENFRQMDNTDSYVSDSCLLAEDGGYLYIRIENNSAINRLNMDLVSITFINLLIRAI